LDEKLNKKIWNLALLELFWSSLSL